MSDQADGGSVDQGKVPDPAGNPPEQPPAPEANGSASNGSANSWLDGLSEGNRKLAETKGWTSPDGLEKALTSYTELERMQGELLRPPGADAPKEEWDKFYSKLPENRRPISAPDQLEFKRPEGLPENLPYDDGLANAAKPWMAEAGLTASQAQIVHDKFAGYMADQALAYQAQVAESVEKAHDDLVKDWGPVDSNGFKEKLELANRAVKELGLVDAYKARGILLEDGSVTDAQIARAFQIVGEKLFKEDTVDGVPLPAGENPFKKGADGRRNLAGMQALAKRDPETAKRMAKEAGVDIDLYFPQNPL